jgi:type I restriction enzyme M protein
MPDSDELGALWQVLDQLRRLLRPEQLRALVLSLVFARSQDASRWTELLVESHPDLRGLLTGLPAEGLAEASIPATATRTILEVVDRIVKRMGGDGAFRLLLEDFAAREGVKGTEVFTPASVTAVLAGLIDVAPRLTVFDPFCRSGEMLTAFALRALDEEPKAVLKLHGETPNAESLAFASMNAILHGQEYDFRLVRADDLLSRSPAGRFSRVIANPPFNMSHWTARDSRDWLFGPPPPGNANFAWLQHIVEGLAADGQAAVLMPNGALSSTNRRERHIRAEMVEAGCVEALIALPPGLFRNSGIPVTVWLLTPPNPARAEILFIGPSEAKHVHGELSTAQKERIINAVQGWRHGGSTEGTGVLAGPLARIREEEYDLSPALYLMRPSTVGADTDALATIQVLVHRLEDQQQEAAKSDATAAQVLRGLSR